MQNKGVVLVVEDDEALRNVNKQSLEMMGHAVHTAATIAQARGLLAQVEPDVLLLDVNLPDGNGLDFCADIRDRFGAHIIIITANSIKEMGARYERSGADQYIRKPFVLGELLDSVENAVSNNSAARRAQ